MNKELLEEKGLCHVQLELWTERLKAVNLKLSQSIKPEDNVEIKEK